MEYDEAYFKHRGFEPGKHYFWSLQIADVTDAKNALDYGCGRGPFVAGLRNYGVNAIGYDPAQAAITSPVEGAKGHIESEKPDGVFDLVLCFDVLEHVTEEEAQAIIDELIKYSKKHILTSICYFNDPNYAKDSTHKTGKSEAWWEHQFTSRGCARKSLPFDFMFRDQCMLFEVVKK